VQEARRGHAAKLGAVKARASESSSHYPWAWTKPSSERSKRSRRYEHAGPFGSEPPQARANLLELHELAHEVINEGHDLNPGVEKMVMLADHVIADMLSLSDLADKIRDTLEALVEATPEP